MSALAPPIHAVCSLYTSLKLSSVPAAGGPQGLEEFDAALRECVRATFEARQAAYVEKVRPHQPSVNSERSFPGCSCA